MSIQTIAALMISVISMTAAARAHDMKAMHPSEAERLPIIDEAPDFALISQDGNLITLNDYRGKVLAVDFIYTSCPDICPMLTANLSQVERALGSDFGRKVAFVSITIDPERDTPQVLKSYAENFRVNLSGWVFLTGDPAVVREVAGRYGTFAERAADGTLNHTLLTSLVDAKGMIRVQYVGYSFDPEEFRRDLLSLVGEAK